MEQILQLVSSSEMFPLWDEFFGYNQVLVVELDRLKTTFKTKWGTFACRTVPFGLINVGNTFHRVMDIAFKGLIGHSMVMYLDHVIFYSKQRVSHPKHLKHIFERCRKYGISLNPKKSIFAFS
jgi:hypothetical protein